MSKESKYLTCAVLVFALVACLCYWAQPAWTPEKSKTAVRNLRMMSEVFPPTSERFLVGAAPRTLINYVSSRHNSYEEFKGLDLKDDIILHAGGGDELCGVLDGWIYSLPSSYPGQSFWPGPDVLHDIEDRLTAKANQSLMLTVVTPKFSPNTPAVLICPQLKWDARSGALMLHGKKVHFFVNGPELLEVLKAS